MAPSGQAVAVVGAGVAGLAAARALAGLGAAVEIFEQAPALTEVGAGLQISPNGARVLAALDIPVPGDRASALELRDWRGRLLMQAELPPTRAGFWLVHRADLIAALAKGAEAAGARLCLGERALSVTTSAARADLALNSGRTVAAELVVAADGLHSILRAQLCGHKQPFFTGHVAWRALVEGDDPDPRIQVFLGPGRHVVSYPLRRGQLRNVVAVEERRAWTAEGWSYKGDPAALRAAFADFAEPVRSWLARVQTAYLWGLFRHRVARRWTDEHGRLALLGDAAHPTLPFLAQGANLALEDAYELAAVFVASRHATWPEGGPRTALAAWAKRRARRARAVVGAATRNGWIWHLRPPLAHVAHTVMRLAARFVPQAALLPFAWVHDYDATAVAEKERPPSFRHTRGSSGD